MSSRFPNRGHSDGHHFILAMFERASQLALVVKNLPANAGDIRDTGLIPGLEGGMATHSSTLAWRVPWTEEPGGIVHRSQRVGHD